MSDGHDGSGAVKEQPPVGAQRQGLGAVAAGEDPHRRRGAWWWLLGALAALVLAGIVIALVASGGSKHHVKVAARPAAPAAATPITPAPAASTPTTAAPPAATPNLLSHGLIGGGGIAVKSATGSFASAGAIGTVLFAEDGTRLDTYARTVVRTAVRKIKADHTKAVSVIGFTDGIGNARLNRTLSLERARKVARALTAKLGGTVRISVEARGKSRPVASNHTAQGRQLNRRVLIRAK